MTLLLPLAADAYSDCLNANFTVGRDLNQGGNPLSCASAEKYMRENPNIKLNDVGHKLFGEELGLGGVEQQFSLLGEMLAMGGTQMEVVRLDVQWTIPLADNLAPVTHPGINASSIRKKYRQYDREGRLMTVPYQSNQQVIYYRRDLFAKHGLTYKHGTWEEFYATLKELQTKERASRAAAGHPNPDSFYGFSTIAGSSANRIAYVFATLLSIFDGGRVVDVNGTVTVNNPGAIQTMAMWQSVYGDIAHPQGMHFGALEAWNSFKHDEAGVIVFWTDTAPYFHDYIANNGWDVAAAPIPGKTGAGCMGQWSYGLSRHTREQEGAQNFLHAAAGDLVYHSLHSTKTQDFLTYAIREDPALWAEYKRLRPTISESHEIYPDFWERATYRPAEGCGPRYEKCAQVVHHNIWKLFRKEVTPAKCAEDMEKELKVLLGILDPSELDDEDKKWTGELIALVIVSVVGSIILGACAVFIFTQAKRLSQTRGFRIPVSVILGLLVISSMGIALGVVISKSDTALRDISEDLAADIRRKSLLVLERSLIGSFESLIFCGAEDWEGAARDNNRMRDVTSVKAQVIARVSQDIANMRFDPRSLVLAIDREYPYRVLFSSDVRQQEPRVSLRSFAGEEITSDIGKVSNVLREALKNLEGWSQHGVPINEKDTMTFTAAADSYSEKKTISANVKNLRVGAEGGTVHREMHWILLYLTPKEVIMKPAEDALKENLHLSITISIIVVLVTVVISIVLMYPLIQLAVNMDLVRGMKMEQVESIAPSLVLEIAALGAGFSYMSKMLVEYKAFLPKSVLVGDDTSSEEEEEEATTQPTDSRCASSKPSRTGNSSASHRSARNAHLGVQLQAGKASVLQIQLHSSKDDHGARLLGEALSQIEHAGSTTGTTFHSFPVLAANQVVLSAGAIKKTAMSGDRIAKAALTVEHVLSGRVSMVAHFGTLSAGNLGNAQTRAFAIMGAPSHLGMISKVAEYARTEAHASITLCTRGFTSRVHTQFNMVPFDIGRDADKDVYIINRLSAPLKENEEEWMYQLESREQDTAQREGELPRCMRVMAKKDGELANVAKEMLGGDHDDALPSEIVAMKLLNESAQSVMYMPKDTTLLGLALADKMLKRSAGKEL